MDNQIVVTYLPLAVLLLIAVFIAAIIPVLSLNLGPKRPTPRKQAPYESGMTPIGEAQRRFPVKFYRIAVLFILFDVDIILLVPWAVAFRKLGFYGLGAMLVFMALFILGDVWVWRKGILEWE
jgi:NADH-quinone oxidoreductase subunit A